MAYTFSEVAALAPSDDPRTASRSSGLPALRSEELPRALDALSQAYPYPGFLFDAAGRLRWMSDEGAARLGLDSARLGAGRLVLANPALEAVSCCARALARDGASDGADALWTLGILRPGERLAARRVAGSRGVHLLLAFVPAMAALPGEGAAASSACVPGLGAVESKVARLAAEGCTVRTIASRLHVTEATVRTHVQRVYRKLGVHSRAELVCAMSRLGR